MNSTNRSVVASALGLLGTIDPATCSPAQLETIAPKLIALQRSPGYSYSNLALVAMQKGWVSKQLAPKYLEGLERDVGSNTGFMYVLITLKDKATYPRLAKSMGNLFRKPPSFVNESAIEPELEQEICKLYSETNSTTARSVILCLGEFGGDIGLEFLTTNAEKIKKADQAAASAAKSAQAKIRRRLDRKSGR